MSKMFFMIVSASIVFCACTRDNPSPPPNPGNTEPSPSVYIAGDSFDLSTGYVPYPVYWKNGQQVHLPHAGASQGTGIAVTDSDVYVSSSGVFLGNNVTYWKNGTGINLADPSVINPTARAITLSGNNVYTVGGAYINNYEYFVPIYWKNEDKAIKIQSIPPGRGDGLGIAVSGNDVYIAGTRVDVSIGYGYSPPCYWKNGTHTSLPATTTRHITGKAKSIFITGSDVHIVGDIDFQTAGLGQANTMATYWKNGKAMDLSLPDITSQANCITVVGSDVYIAGAVNGADGLPHATYWKNGVAVTLDSKTSVANALAVYENDVYVVGNRSIDSALYWKNGKAVMLGRGRANAIVVKK